MRWYGWAMLGTAALASPAFADAQVGLEVLAVSGEPAPGTNRVFHTFQYLSLNASGDAVFEAYLEAAGGGIGDWTLYLASEGELQLIARRGDHAPGTPPGAQFAGVGSLPSLDDAGVVTFFGALVLAGGVTAANDEGFWAYDPGTEALSLLAREGEPAPGGGLFSAFSGGHTQSPAGHVAFYPSDGSASWVRDPGGPLRRIAAAGEPAPGAGGALFGFIGFPWLGGSGGAAFEANLAFSQEWALFAPDGAGGVTLRARGGAPAPGAPPGALFDVFLLGDVNGAGEISFFALLLEGPGGVVSGDRAGIWGPDGSGAPGLLARAGAPAPGVPGAFFQSFRQEVYLDELGRTAFVAFLELGPGGVTQGDNQGLWRSDGAGGLELLVREGDLLEGGSSSYASLTTPVVADAGDLAFWSEVAGPGSGSGNALVFVDGTGRPEVVLRNGSVVDVAPGDARSVSFVSPLIGNNQAAGHRSLNDARQVAFHARFDDASEAVGVATVPEPGPALLLLTGTAVLVAARARRRRRPGVPRGDMPR